MSDLLFHILANRIGLRRRAPAHYPMLKNSPIAQLRKSRSHAHSVVSLAISWSLPASANRSAIGRCPSRASSRAVRAAFRSRRCCDGLVLGLGPSLFSLFLSSGELGRIKVDLDKEGID